MEGYQAELTVVQDELAVLETQLEDLLERQNELFKRKTELESILKQNANKPSVCNKQWEKRDFTWSSNLENTMRSVFKINELRPMQLQTMNVTMSKKDCILIMPTGGGKSLCFQLPALLSNGITLVVSPLVSLMEDQVMALEQNNIEAAMLNAEAGKEKVKFVHEAMIDKNATLKLVYVTPEKLSKSKRFMARLEKTYKVGRFARLVIDEVHCCSQWGHDFRPDYKFLGIMKRQFPDVPILGLTATATTSVLEDVKKILNIQACQLFKASFNRPNLFYEVRPKPSVQKDVMDDIQKLIKSKFPAQSGIIYTFSKKEAQDVTVDLQSRGIKAGCYHADISARDRSRVHKAWIDNHIQVVVATVAFGMGIDKPDVRFVIHHSLSKSMENLYQESGRAGRDDKRAHCIVYYRLQDVFRQSSMVMTEQTGLTNLYGIVSYCIDAKRCRRSVIAQYFGESWESSQCNKMCDHCNSTFGTENKDITGYCVNVLKILDNASCIDSKLTAIKLIDALQGKGPTANRIKGSDTNTSREKLEVIVAYMLLKQYLREDFHFTPYSTISYLIPGSKARLLQSGQHTVHLDVPTTRSVPKAPKASNSDLKPSTKNANNGSCQSDLKSSAKCLDEKPEIVIINKQRSVFTKKSFSLTTSEKSVSQNTDIKPSVKKCSTVPCSSTTTHSASDKGSGSRLKLKRKNCVVISDTDSDSDLEFGDEVKLKHVPSVNKKSRMSRMSVKIDSDSDLEFGDEVQLKHVPSVNKKSRTLVKADSDSDLDFGDEVKLKHVPSLNKKSRSRMSVIKTECNDANFKHEPSVVKKSMKLEKMKGVNGDDCNIVETDHVHIT